MYNNKTDSMRKILLIAMLGCLLLFLVVAVVITVKSGTSFDAAFFSVCCGSIEIVGKAVGLKYKEMSTVINTYLQSGLCVLSALWVTWDTVRRFLRRKTVGNGVLMSLGAVYGAAYIAGFVWVCKHYDMSLEAAFDLVYSELVHLTQVYDISYNNLNYLIFIVLFLVIIVGNMLIAKAVRHFQRERVMN
jgi:hypothetical protein